MRILLQASPSLASVMILLTICGTAVGTIPWQTSAQSGNVFYFHYKSILYQSNNSSITLLEEANLSKPVEVIPQVVDVASAIRNATTLLGTVWVGTISWISQPLAEPAVIRGSVIFGVWLSSNDTTPAFSGVGAGIAVIDQHNQTVGNYAHSYSYTRGKIITVSAKEYNFNVDLDREVEAGQRLVFAVGVGSTTAGWLMKVYFDATQYPSHAQLPSSVLVLAIPEFTQVPVTLMVVVAIIVSLSLVQRRLRLRTECVGE
jgi:hypothetical protein